MIGVSVIHDEERFLFQTIELNGRVHFVLPSTEGDTLEQIEKQLDNFAKDLGCYIMPQYAFSFSKEFPNGRDTIVVYQTILNSSELDEVYLKSLNYTKTALMTLSMLRKAKLDEITEAVMEAYGLNEPFVRMKVTLDTTVPARFIIDMYSDNPEDVDKMKLVTDQMETLLRKEMGGRVVREDITK